MVIFFWLFFLISSHLSPLHLSSPVLSFTNLSPVLTCCPNLSPVPTCDLAPGFGPSPSYPSFGAAAPNSNVIVVDTNSLDDKDKDKLSKKAKKKAAKKAAEAAPPQPWTPQAVMQSQAQVGGNILEMYPKQKKYEIT